MQSTGQASTQAVSFTPMQGSAITYAIGHLRYLTVGFPEAEFKRSQGKLWRMAMRAEKISAVTLRVLNMKASVQFYRDVLGMELLYGGESAGFSSPREGCAICHPQPGRG